MEKITESQKVLILQLLPYVGQTSSLGTTTAPNSNLASSMLVGAKVQVLLFVLNCSTEFKTDDSL